MEQVVLEVKNVTKRFPGVLALSNVNFRLSKGKVHALMGENGAGKSTLMKIIAGIYQADEGDVFLHGEKVVFHTPKQALLHGISMIGVNMLINTEEPYHYVGPDDVLAGELEMQNAIDAIGGEGNVVILEGPIGQSAQIQRLEGNMNILKKYEGKVELLAQQTANWSREEALSLVENWIETFGGKIDAVVAQNDEMALGAIQALEAAGVKDKVVVTAVDAIKDGCNAVKEGKLLGTVYQDAALEGQEAVQKAFDVLEGKVTEKKLDYIDMPWITTENVDDLLTTIYAD